MTPPISMSNATLLLDDAAATETAGALLAPALRPGMIVTLAGELGAGKTTLVRGCLRNMGWPGAVKSPTYSLVEHYPFSSLYFYHFDFYRFADPSEWETAGLADCFRDDSVCMVEWPEHAGPSLPVADLEMTLAHPVPDGAPGRELTLRAHTEAGERCLQAIIGARPSCRRDSRSSADARASGSSCPRRSCSLRRSRGQRHGPAQRGCGPRTNTRASSSRGRRRFPISSRRSRIRTAWC